MRRDDADPGLPVKLHPVSNGEFVPPPSTDLERETAKRARVDASRIAKRLGMDRRRFLLSSMATALTLTTLSACSDEKAKSGSPGKKPGGRYTVPPEATTEPDAARDALGGREFIFDVQTHFLDDTTTSRRTSGSGSPRTTAARRTHASASPVDKYLDLLFNKSDTDMIVISALPFAGSPLKPEVMRKTIDLADRLCGDHRTLMQGEAHRRSGRPQRLPRQHGRAAARPAHRRRGRCTRTPAARAGGSTTTTPRPRRSARRSSTRSARLGPTIIAVHKGFVGIGGRSRRTPTRSTSGRRPRPTPTSSFVVYHSGYDAEAPSSGTVRPSAIAVRRRGPAHHVGAQRPASSPAATSTPSWARRGGR